jgi:hypothetical protein
LTRHGLHKLLELVRRPRHDTADPHKGNLVLPDQLSNSTFFVPPRYEETIGDICQGQDGRLSHIASVLLAIVREAI